MSRFHGEIEHLYGKNVHLLDDPVLTSALAKLCAQGTEQPQINQLITSIYSDLLKTVINAEFPTLQVQIPTRMAEAHPKEGILTAQVLDPSTSCVSINLARAGTLPSHTCYDKLNNLLDPRGIRQDHISIARATDSNERVTGSLVSGHKIGGSIDNRIALIPDPMGATGSTVLETLNLYKNKGNARKWITLHCIITPEYLKNVLSQRPDVIIYAIRLDRGLSDKKILGTLPGTHWDQEKGLNSKQYIVPGGGGFGEILNNAYV